MLWSSGVFRQDNQYVKDCFGHKKYIAAMAFGHH
jgi:hypothetical protein